MNNIHKKFFKLCLFALIIGISAESCTSSNSSCQSNEITDSIDTISSYKERDTTFLDIFYGMEEHYTEGSEHCVLDSISGIAKLELKDEWSFDEDKFRFPASLCIYTDSLFRNDSIARFVYTYIEERLRSDLMCYKIPDESFRPDTYAPNMSYKEIFELGTQYFRQQSRLMHNKGQESFETCPAFRYSLVAIAIHSTADYVTFMFQSSFDYNGSNGCPSYSRYITIMNDGTPIDKNDLIQIYPNIMKKDRELKDAYMEAHRSKWDDPSPDLVPPVSIENNDSDFAIVKEGVLFYYPPYTIGYGSEGQYNLIVKM